MVGCGLFSSQSHILNSRAYVTFIIKVYEKDICDFKCQLLCIMGDQIRVTVIIESVKLKKLRLETTIDWIKVDILLNVIN